LGENGKKMVKMGRHTMGDKSLTRKTEGPEAFQTCESGGVS